MEREERKFVVTLLGTTPKKLETGSTSGNRPPLSWNRTNGIVGLSSVTLHHVADPCTGERRLYAVMRKPSVVDEKLHQHQELHNNLCELQMLPSRGNDDDDMMYSSFLIKSASTATLIGNGNIYLLTTVDPLFFAFPLLDSKEAGDLKKNTENASTNQWQPLDQIMSSFDPVVRSCLDPSQLPHLYASMELGEDEVFYKFSQDLAMVWLRRKLDTLKEFLMRHHSKNKAQYSNCQGASVSTSRGAFSEDFVIPEDARTASTEEQPESTIKEDMDKIARISREESIQIICSYLSDEWRTRFLNHVHESPEILLTQKQKIAAKRPQSDLSSNILSHAHHNMEQPVEKKAKKETPVSAGVKKLATVNTKGMKKMSAFFTVAKKKTKKAY